MVLISNTTCMPCGVKGSSLITRLGEQPYVKLSTPAVLVPLNAKVFLKANRYLPQGSYVSWLGIIYSSRRGGPLQQSRVDPGSCVCGRHLEVGEWVLSV